jgi:hypothetical protein
MTSSERRAGCWLRKAAFWLPRLSQPRDLQLLARLEAQRNRDFAILDEMREAFKDVLPEEIEREVARVLGQVRAENRTKRSPATP